MAKIQEFFRFFGKTPKNYVSLNRGTADSSRQPDAGTMRAGILLQVFRFSLHPFGLGVRFR
jgi:hypothetical protein